MTSDDRGPLRAAAFVDRDGVITEPVLDPTSGTHESPLDPRETELAAGAIEGLRGLKARGLLIVVVSNQPAAAKGTATMAALDQVHRRTVELLELGGVVIDAWHYCFHHPDGVVDGLAGPCACRKPRAGLLLSAAADYDIDLAGSWMIGDAHTDLLAGEAAGCATILIEHPRTAHRRLGAANPLTRTSDLAAAAVAVALSRPQTQVAQSAAASPPPAGIPVSESSR